MLTCLKHEDNTTGKVTTRRGRVSFHFQEQKASYSSLKSRRAKKRGGNRKSQNQKWEWRQEYGQAPVKAPAQTQAALGLGRHLLGWGSCSGVISEKLAYLGRKHHMCAVDMDGHNGLHPATALAVIPAAHAQSFLGKPQQNESTDPHPGPKAGTRLLRRLSVVQAPPRSDGNDPSSMSRRGVRAQGKDVKVTKWTW